LSARRDLFPADPRLLVCMTIVLALEAIFTVATVVGLLALTFLVHKGWSVSFFIVVLALVGALKAGRPVRFRDRGRPVRPGDEGRVGAIVQRLCVVGDIPVPRVCVNRHRLAQSWTLAVPWRAPRVYVTTGLLDALDDREPAAVVAHELSHIAQRDALVMTIAAAPGIWVLQGLGDLWRRGRHDEPIRSLIAARVWLLFAMPALPFALLARVLSRFRELAADQGAARLTGSPAAVSAALVALSESLAKRRATDLRTPAPAVLNILPTRPARGVGRLWAAHPGLERRLAALERMEARLQRTSATARTSAR
jgi:heat shock protein HtpX